MNKIRILTIIATVSNGYCWTASEPNPIFTLMATGDNTMYFAFYESTTGKRRDNVRPLERIKQPTTIQAINEGNLRGYTLSMKTGDRELSIPNDGSLTLVVSRSPHFPPALSDLNRNTYVALEITHDTGRFIKPVLNALEGATNVIQSFESRQASNTLIEKVPPRPEKSVSTEEWIRRYNKGQPVPETKVMR
jgi:hypothetical protein